MHYRDAQTFALKSWLVATGFCVEMDALDCGERLNEIGETEIEFSIEQLVRGESLSFR